jgi:DNA-binding beta-propeller fold protein YncE
MRPLKLATAAVLSALAATPALALQIYVSNEKDNTVTVIDGNTLQ